MINDDQIIDFISINVYPYVTIISNDKSMGRFEYQFYNYLPSYGNNDFQNKIKVTIIIVSKGLNKISQNMILEFVHSLESTSVTDSKGKTTLTIIMITAAPP